MEILKVGDTVLWSADFGIRAPVPAKVTKIELVEPTPDRMISSKCIEHDVVVTLDNGFWAYGYQIKPVPKRPKRGKIVKL